MRATRDGEAAGRSGSARATGNGSTRSGRRAHLVVLAGELFAQKGYRATTVREIERIWVTQLEAGKESGVFRADLDAKLTYRLLRDILWIPEQWRRTRGYSTDQVVDGFLRILFDGIANRA